ncbi:MAG: serine/threonine protein kinase [Anaerolineales bacterium]|jgi:serine/threonine-protein kinase|nr:serine/threonine protein kinase [Anaerolineales bacterium]
MSLLNKYILHEELGHGGFATVYRATHANLDYPVAVKVLHPALLQDEKSRLRFIREAQTASRLEHPHIVRILDLIEAPEEAAIVMEYLPGGDLHHWASEHQPLPRSELLRILGQVASALDYAHQQGVLHRDVKPGNILLDAAGSARLADFGLVRPAEAPHLTRIGSVVGTATYLAPEQAEARPEIDGRADQYALAVVAYELLAGQLPFQGENSTAVSLMHLTKPPPPPSSLNNAVTREVDEVLLRALAKEPSARYPTCAAFVLALESALAAGDMRRFRELLLEARGLLEQGQYTAMGQKMDEASRLLGEGIEPRQALLELDQARRQAEIYQQGARDWQTARQKAQTVLEGFSDYPDPQGIFPVLELRAARWRLPALREVLLQGGLGLALGLTGAVLVLLFVFFILIL